jgi:4-azaleucine resistance transporter AzlC
MGMNRTFADSWLRLFTASLPVAFGYLPLGVAFGVLLTGLGYSWWWATVMSLFIFAGSAQFLAVSLLAAGASPFDAFMATLLLNLRHIFYGLTLLDRYRTLGRGRTYAIFALTDETFSLLVGQTPGNPDRRWVLGLTGLNQFWWVAGSTLGGLWGHSIPFSTEGLSFALTALFAVLLIEQLARGFRIASLAGALMAAAVCLFLLPGKYFLLAAMGLSALFLCCLPRRATE